jgi:hypothetical protein
MTSRHQPKDRNGRRIRVGDKVRVIGAPDLSGMSKGGISESLPVFRYLVGKYKRISGFDQFGCAHLDFAIPSGKYKGWHGVMIEPTLLHFRQPRSNPSTSGRAKSARRSTKRWVSGLERLRNNRARKNLASTAPTGT